MKLFWPGHFDSKMLPTRNDPTSVRTTTLAPIAKGTNNMPSHTTAKSEDIIEVNFRYTALIATCLGFLFVWSTVVSSIFLKNSLDENSLLQKPVEIFEKQEKIGRILFQVGQEMLFSVDASVSVQLNLTSVNKLKPSLDFTWNLTDTQIIEVRDELEPSSELLYLLTIIESKLAMIRHDLALATENPLNIISSYKFIFDLTDQMTVDKFTSILSSIKLYDFRWHLLMSFAEIQSAPYALFLRGMNRKFLELSYGTVYHFGPEFFNHTNSDAELSNYFYYAYSSNELIENAFSWDSRIRHRYTELLKTRHTQIFYSNSHFYRQNSREYTRFVTHVVAYLLSAKDVLNMSFREVLFQFVSKSNTFFYCLIALIYFLALIACTIFFVLFIRNAKIKSAGVKKQPLETISSQHY